MDRANCGELVLIRMSLRVAVTITTHNRRSELERTLAHLSRLAPAPDEIFVCADGCQDGGSEWQGTIQAPGPTPEQALPSEEALPAPQSTPTRQQAPPVRSSSALRPRFDQLQTQRVARQAAQVTAIGRRSERNERFFMTPLHS